MNRPGLYDRIFNRSQRVATGLASKEWITAAGGEHTGEWAYFLPVTACVFTTLTQQGRTTGSEDPAALGSSFTAGIPVPGPITTIELASGSGWALGG